MLSSGITKLDLTHAWALSPHARGKKGVFQQQQKYIILFSAL